MPHSRQIAATIILLAACIPLPAQRPIAKSGPLKSVVFVENRGEFDPAVKYKLTGQASTVWLTATGIVFDGARLDGTSHEQVTFSERFVGSNPNIALEAGQPSTIGAFSTKWITRMSRPGISVRLAGNGTGIEQEFIIQAGADADNIAVHYEGVDEMTIDEHGSHNESATAMGTLRECAEGLSASEWSSSCGAGPIQTGRSGNAWLSARRIRPRVPLNHRLNSTQLFSILWLCHRERPSSISSISLPHRLSRGRQLLALFR